MSSEGFGLVFGALGAATALFFRYDYDWFCWCWWFGLFLARRRLLDGFFVVFAYVLDKVFVGSCVSVVNAAIKCFVI